MTNLIAILQADRIAEAAHHEPLPCVPKWGFWMATRIQSRTGIKARAHSDGTIHVDGDVLPVADWRGMEALIANANRPHAVIV